MIIELNTKEELDIIDITEQVKQFVKQSKIENGIINIQTLHTTTALVLNENEPRLLQDFKNHLNKIAPKNDKYLHNDLDQRKMVCENECINGHSHCRAIHLPSNICLNILKSQLQLGQWQSILFIELDHARPRKIQLNIIS